jgi:hypothetical protein
VVDRSVGVGADDGLDETPMPELVRREGSR